MRKNSSIPQEEDQVAYPDLTKPRPLHRQDITWEYARQHAASGHSNFCAATEEQNIRKQLTTNGIPGSGCRFHL